MRPALVVPYHDPTGVMFRILRENLPRLKEHVDHVYMSVETDDWATQHIRFLQADDFFTLFPVERGLGLGEHFAMLYRQASTLADPEQVLHLCFLDRLTFVLGTEHGDSFLADLDTLSPDDTPLIYHRSPKAWASHPKNYLELESFVTRIGETLFGKSLDYAWCHFVIRAGLLREIMPHVKNPDLSMVAEIVLLTQDHIHTRDVDWLAWEDPFLFSRDPLEFKRERESNPEEVQKRLSYVLPMVETLARFARANMD
jgi:hypothetical protein